jgi:gliding motility-associated-like protein
MSLAILRGIPQIVFASQGDTVSTTLTPTSFFLSASCNSGALPLYFTQLTPSSAVVLSNDTSPDSLGKVNLYAEGTTTIEVYFPGTDNYEEGRARAKVYATTSLQAPDANVDELALVFGEASSIELNLLLNDEAYTGSLLANSVDLDPERAGQQKAYVSPSLGLFEVDTTGLVTYVPFAGFIGSGEIFYTIKDTKGSVSRPGILRVAVVLKSEAPALKATELITPNGDGLNEAFVIGYVNLDKPNKLKIFDRNGEQLFLQNDYQNNWSGELSNGKLAENGIYYYVFIEGDDNSKRELKGVVEVRR